MREHYSHQSSRSTAALHHHPKGKCIQITFAWHMGRRFAAARFKSTSARAMLCKAGYRSQPSTLLADCTAALEQHVGASGSTQRYATHSRATGFLPRRAPRCPAATTYQYVLLTTFARPIACAPACVPSSRGCPYVCRICSGQPAGAVSAVI